MTENEKPSVHWTPGFPTAFWLGFGVIFLSKLLLQVTPLFSQLQARPIWSGTLAASIAIVIMFIYMSRHRSERVESDWPRLGDEVYYLGLLYTLSSLCASLVIIFLLPGFEQTEDGLGVENRINEMIGSFGIALVTTIAGIVMRTTLQRGIEEDRRSIVIRMPHGGEGGTSGSASDIVADLQSYAFELRNNLQASTNAFASHTTQAIIQAKTVQAHMEELMSTFHDGLERKADTASDRMDKLMSAFQTGVENRAKGIIDNFERVHLKAVSQSETQLRQSQELHEETRNAIRNFASQIITLDQSIKTISSGSRDATEKLGTLSAEWAAIQNRASKEILVFQEGTAAIANLGKELQRASVALGVFPRQIEQVSDAIKRLTDAASKTGDELPAIQAQSALLTAQLQEAAEVSAHQRRASDLTLTKLHALSKAVEADVEARQKFGGTVDTFVALDQAAVDLGEKFRDLEGDIRRIKTELASAQRTLQENLTNFAATRTRFDDTGKGWLDRIMRRKGNA